MAAAYDWTSCAATTISSRKSRSGDIEAHRRTQDCLAAKAIEASFNRRTREQIDVTAEDLPQLILHVDVIEEAPTRIWSKRDEHVHRVAEPKSASSVIFHLRQKSRSLSLSISMAMSGIAGSLLRR